jgi:hypothetical protein
LGVLRYKLAYIPSLTVDWILGIKKWEMGKPTFLRIKIKQLKKAFLSYHMLIGLHESKLNFNLDCVYLLW